MPARASLLNSERLDLTIHVCLLPVPCSLRVCDVELAHVKDDDFPRGLVAAFISECKLGTCCCYLGLSSWPGLRILHV